MYIKRLLLKNYRNYEETEISFDNGVNIIYGDNAEGKTNLLEAIFLSSTSKSHKNSKENEIIKFNKDEAHINLIFNKENKDHIIDIQLNKESKKGIALDRVKIEKLSDFLGTFSVIIFAPEDLNIIKDGPQIRRKFIDMLLCQIDKMYINYLSNYNKILNQRNILLKDIKQENVNKVDLINLLEVYDEKLAEYGKIVIEKRKKLIDELKTKIKEIHKEISDDKEDININYETIDREFIDLLREKREEDLKNLFTSVGPHRDDIGFFIKDKDVRKFGSQGQKKTAAISLKLSELKIIKEKIKDNPVLLLDDVFSELDEKRQKNLVESLKNIQTIITCTGIKRNIFDLLNAKAIYKVSESKITKVSN